MATVATEAGLGRLVAEAASLTWPEIPPRLQAHTVRVFADTIGAILAGGLQPETIALARDRSILFDAGKGSSTILVPGLPRAAAARAAFVNGTAGTFLELDEACPPASHPSIHVVPAALAAAEALERSGSDLMTAFAAGYEVVARLFDAYVLPYPVHPHGHLGAIGGAVAVAMLRGADPIEPAYIAASSPLVATWDACHEGATVRNTWAGLAGECAVRANELAESGFTGSRAMIGTVFGKLLGELRDPNALARTIVPGQLRIGENYFKFHSACAGTHAALDATLGLGRVDAQSVESILVELPPQNWKLNAQSPGNDLANRFSIPYAVAAAIIHGHTGPAAFRTDPRAQALAARVRVQHADDLDAPDSALRMPARVTVDLGDRTLTSSVEHPYGHPLEAASADRLREKFNSIAGPEGHGLYERLMRIEQLENVRHLFAPAAPTVTSA